MVNECDYEKKIRLNGEALDVDEKKSVESQGMDLEDNTELTGCEDAEVGRESTVTDDKDDTHWYSPITNMFTGGSGGSGDNKKKNRSWDQKSISEWSHKDVISWIKSLTSSDKYCPQNFPKYIDGKELLVTADDDFALFIKKKIWRRRFIQQLDKAKQKYDKAMKLDGAEYEYDDIDDDEKERSGDLLRDKDENEVNGVVGLQNQGNTCYMNTSIQILSQSPFITRYLYTRAKLIKDRDGSNGYYPMLNAWTELCDIIYNQNKPKSRWSNIRNYKVVKPAAIRNALEN